MTAESRRPRLPCGCVQVYTGDGKGKTTAALGLSLRAAGAGLKVFFAQFLKAGDSSEFEALKRHEDQITVRQYGRGCFIQGQPDAADIAAARTGLAEVRDILAGGEHDVVVLDEVNCAVDVGLFSAEELLEVLDVAAPHVERICTGRNAHPKILDRADLITDMAARRHYHTRGLPARAGIEK